MFSFSRVPLTMVLSTVEVTGGGRDWITLLRGLADSRILAKASLPLGSTSMVQRVPGTAADRPARPRHAPA